MAELQAHKAKADETWIGKEDSTGVNKDLTGNEETRTQSQHVNGARDPLSWRLSLKVLEFFNVSVPIGRFKCIADTY